MFYREDDGCSSVDARGANNFEPEPIECHPIFAECAACTGGDQRGGIHPRTTEVSCSSDFACIDASMTGLAANDPDNFGREFDDDTNAHQSVDNLPISIALDREAYGYNGCDDTGASTLAPCAIANQSSASRCANDRSADQCGEIVPRTSEGAYSSGFGATNANKNALGASGLGNSGKACANGRGEHRSV